MVAGGWFKDICYNLVPGSTTFYDITVVTKAGAVPPHPYEGTGSSSGYAVNGVAGAEIKLVRGHSYTLRTNSSTSGHPFEFRYNNGTIW